MPERKSLKLPIVLAVVMIAMLIALIVGWVFFTVPGSDDDQPGLSWAAMAIGTTFLAVLLVGVILYLALSIKAINLTSRQQNFIDSVTHELKSPIASLKLYLQTMDRRQVTPQQQHDFCRFMLEDVERLDLLINHVLEAARLERRADDKERCQVAVDQLLELCARNVCLRYRLSTDIIQLDLDPCLLDAAPVDLDMIFRNLLDNAVKYSADEPQVVVSLRCESEGWLVVRIRDNGPGIPPQLRRKIFGRFVRLGKELEREKPGTGLGLYIVRTLIKRLGGKIRVDSPDSGTGTVFEVQLPGGRATGGRQGDEEDRYEPEVLASSTGEKL
ncbi:MAG: HAMP domain-containing histidine kinase [Planctomycetales bacterium]|nr:HAMP domain-containing histidine kinase [Planctomycetales bacterium]